MEIFNQQKLEEHYSRIFEQNKQKILKGGTGDEYLLSPDKDTRMALALVIRINDAVCNHIEEYLGELKGAEPNLYYYPRQDFHITVMDLLRGILYRGSKQIYEIYCT